MDAFKSQATTTMKKMRTMIMISDGEKDQEITNFYEKIANLNCIEFDFSNAFIQHPYP